MLASLHAVIGLLCAAMAIWAVLIYRRGWRCRFYYATGFGVLAVYLALCYLPSLPLALMGCWTWGHLIVPLGILPVVLLLFLPLLAVRVVWRRILYTALLGLILVYQLMGRVELLLVDHGELTGRVDASGVCRQTSGYSCGPAALAMLLALHGVKRDEAEIAADCMSSWHNGTNPYLVCGYLRRTLDRRTHRVELSFGADDRPAPPYLEVVEYTLLADHWVLVAAADADGYLIRDPLHGERRLSRVAHEKRSRHRFVAVEE